MKSLYRLINSRPKMALLFLGFFLAVIVIGWKVETNSRNRVQEKQLADQAAYAAAPQSALQSVNAAMPDPKVQEIMAKYHVGANSANRIAQAKIEVLSRTDTSVHFALTFPDHTTVDETATIAADAAYTPTASDLERAARRGSQVHGVKLTNKKTGEKTGTYTLQYHVPYSALPADLQQKIHAAPARSKTARFFDLVPVVRAQGAEATGEAVISVIANYFAESYKTWKKVGGEWEEFENGKSLGADVPLAAVDLLEDGLSFKGWMDDLKKLEDCAKNPTNPLSQKASQDPNYQHEVMDQLNDAVGDVQSTAVPTLASDAAGYLSHFLPFGGGAVTTIVFSTQDEAVSEYAEGRIKEAEKYLVPCEDMPDPPGVDHGDGSITFHTQLKNFNSLDSYERYVKSDFNLLQSGAGMFQLSGTGEFKQRSSSSQFKTTNKCAAQAGVSGNGSSMMGYRVLTIGSHMINGSGDCEMNTAGHVTHSSNYQDPGVVCKFDNVDFVNGGHYETHPEGEPVWSEGTECVLELRPRQK